MAFGIKNSNENIFKEEAGTVLSYHPKIILTADNFDKTKLVEVGKFVTIDGANKNTMLPYDGTNWHGVAVQDTTNLGYECDKNPLQVYITFGLVFVKIKDGIDPKRGQFVKLDASGVADIGARTDGVGIFHGQYGQTWINTDKSETKVMLIQLGGI